MLLPRDCRCLECPVVLVLPLARPLTAFDAVEAAYENLCRFFAAADVRWLTALSLLLLMPRPDLAFDAAAALLRLL